MMTCDIACDDNHMFRIISAAFTMTTTAYVMTTVVHMMTSTTFGMITTSFMMMGHNLLDEAPYFI